VHSARLVTSTPKKDVAEHRRQGFTEITSQERQTGRSGPAAGADQQAHDSADARSPKIRWGIAAAPAASVGGASQLKKNPPNRPKKAKASQAPSAGPPGSGPDPAPAAAGSTPSQRGSAGEQKQQQVTVHHGLVWPDRCQKLQHGDSGRFALPRISITVARGRPASPCVNP